MRSVELTTGRTLAVAFDHGEDFFPTLAAFCRDNGIRHGYIPMFIAGFSEVEVVGACEKLQDPDAPVWSKVHLTNVEALGAGTLAYDPDADAVLPHIHVSVGEKARSAVGHTSHLLAATVQFLVEMVVVEVTSPVMTRPKNPTLYDVPTLTFGPDSGPARNPRTQGYDDATRVQSSHQLICLWTRYGDTVMFADDLLAEGDPEVEFRQGVADRMPRKRVAAGALIRDTAGRILMVEPVYKPTWDIPGGVVEANETPLDACRREVLEELGVDIPLSRLLVIDWVPQQGVWHDALMFIFDGGVFTPEQAAGFTLQDDELAGAHFVTLDQATHRIRPAAARRLAAALDAVDTSQGPVYLQFGRRTLPT